MTVVIAAHRGRRLRRGPLVVAALIAIGAAIVIDLVGPMKTDIRVFDPDRVALLDTEMWRAYYAKQPLPLYLELAQLLREEFHFPPLRSYVVAAHAARAAFVFKSGRDRADYVKALPDLISYYAAIRRVSITPFDVRQTAALELEWWIVHRDRDPAALARALANGAAALYQVAPDSLMEYGRLRTDAMVIRDAGGDGGRVVSEADWSRIASDLRGSWGSLSRVVRPK